MILKKKLIPIPKTFGIGMISLIVLGSFFSPFSAHAALKSYDCKVAYETFIKKEFEKDTWLSTQIKLLRFGLGLQHHYMESIPILIFFLELPVYPFIWPVAIAHDLLYKVKRYLYQQHYTGILQTYSLQDMLYNFDIRVSWQYLPLRLKSEEEFEHIVDPIKLVEISGYKNLIESKTFAFISEFKDLNSSEYPRFVKHLLSIYKFGTEFCGTDDTPEFKAITSLNL